MSTTTRARRIRTTAATEIPEELQQLAREVAKANKEKNSATAAEKKARDKLYQKMKGINLERFQTSALIDGKKVNLQAVIETPTRSKVDVEKLSKLVPNETLMLMVSVTQDAVKEHSGESVLRQVLVTTEGTENVNVSAVK